MKTYILAHLFPLLLCFCACSNAQQLAFEKSDEGILLKEKGQARFFYQTATKSLDGNYPRANYVHPLYGLEGEVLTEDFPEDHFHHRGIFWTWHQLYVNGKRIADPWFCEGISWKVKNTETTVQNNQATIQATVEWLADSLQNRAVLEEQVTITFHRLETNAYALTFDITMTALVNGLELGGSEDAKGYGGFSPRIKLPKEVMFRSEGKEIIPQNLPVHAGPWMSVEGKFGHNSPSTITIMGAQIGRAHV